MATEVLPATRSGAPPPDPTPPAARRPPRRPRPGTVLGLGGALL